MPLPAVTNNNKESFRLLDLSSDLESDDLQLEIAPSKKKKLQRRPRGGVRITGGDGAPVTNNKMHWGRSIRYAAYAAALAWLVVLTYAAAALHERLSSLDVNLQQVSTTSKSVDGGLQVCHTAAQELRANASSLGERLALLTAAHEALADNSTRTAAELKALQDKLAAAPELADTPRRLTELSQTVAALGSRLGSLDETTKLAHETAQAAAKGIDELQQKMNASIAATNASVAERALTAESLKALSDGILELNATIATRLAATEKRLDEYQAKLKSDAAALAELEARITAAPTTSTSTVASTVAQKSPQESVSSVAAPAASPAPEAAPADAPVAAATAPSTTTTTAGATKPPILQSPA